MWILLLLFVQVLTQATRFSVSQANLGARNHTCLGFPREMTRHWLKTPLLQRSLKCVFLSGAPAYQSLGPLFLFYFFFMCLFWDPQNSLETERLTQTRMTAGSPLIFPPEGQAKMAYSLLFPSSGRLISKFDGRSGILNVLDSRGGILTQHIPYSSLNP